MRMKKFFGLVLACLLLVGCANEKVEAEVNTAPAEETTTAEVEQTEPNTIHPIPDTTMDNLTDAILSVSLAEGDAYVDDKGQMQMALKIYTYDKYDMVDIAALQVGDIIVTHDGEVEVTSKEQNEAGLIYINGGEENGGFDLFTDDCGLYFETGFNDAKNWYEVGEAVIRVSVDFEGVDSSDPEGEEVILYPGDFLTDAVENYDFTPYNTTVRVEEGQIVELHRSYTP